MLMSAVAIHVKTVVPALMLLIALHATVLLDTLAQTVKQVVFHSRPAFSRIDCLNALICPMQMFHIRRRIDYID
jgi:hypothetical protein